MATVQVELDHVLGKMKPMHAVNNGPVKAPRMFPFYDNFEAYKEAGFPYARNSDASYCQYYGGDHTVDITAVFPNFDADPYDPASYDFACTDHYTATTLEAGTEIFYRLGQKIDHRIKKYDSKPPKDYKKWAIICEHIVRHYNYGWADGFHYNIKYWEIWNEPGNFPECWEAPIEEFYPLFEITARHLKGCFPEIRIGGPAFATGPLHKYTDAFLSYMREHDVPLDFYSWHLYRAETSEYEKRILFVRERLDFYGFTKTESILSEWNFIKNWKEDMVQSKKELITIKGAAFYAALMAFGQNMPVDMLMYYDTSIASTLNGIFFIYTREKLKGYYPFFLFSKLYRIGQHVKTVSDTDCIYAVAAAKDGKDAIMLSYFTNDKSAAEEVVTLKLTGSNTDCYSLYLLDETHDAENVGQAMVENGEITLTMAPNTVVFLENA